MTRVPLPISRLVVALALVLGAGGCSHTLIIESTPGDAEVFLSGDPSSPGRSLGKTPLALPITEAVVGEFGYLTVQKPGFERVTTVMTRGSVGAMRQALKFHLKPGDSRGTLASRLLVHVRNSQRFAEALQFSEAHREIDEALRLDPTFVFGKSFKAGLFFMEKKWPEASRLYREVLALEPSYEEAAKMLARIQGQSEAISRSPTQERSSP
jgi:hypothetical protein